jgi:hypothetical protein
VNEYLAIMGVALTGALLGALLTLLCTLSTQRRGVTYPFLEVVGRVLTLIMGAFFGALMLPIILTAVGGVLIVGLFLAVLTTPGQSLFPPQRR